MTSDEYVVIKPNDSDPFAWLGATLGLGIGSLISGGIGWWLIQNSHETASYGVFDVQQTDEKQFVLGVGLLLLASVLWVLMLVVLGTVVAHKTLQNLD